MTPEQIEALCLTAIRRAFASHPPEHPNAPIVIKHRLGWDSCGATTWRTGAIRLSVGVYPTDAHLVALHEAAHAITASDRGHTVRFWRVAWELYHDQGIPQRYAHDREGDYMKRAVPTLHRMLDAGKLPTWQRCCLPNPDGLDGLRDLLRLG